MRWLVAPSATVNMNLRTRQTSARGFIWGSLGQGRVSLSCTAYAYLTVPFGSGEWHYNRTTISIADLTPSANESFFTYLR